MSGFSAGKAAGEAMQSIFAGGVLSTVLLPSADTEDAAWSPLAGLSC